MNSSPVFKHQRKDFVIIIIVCVIYYKISCFFRILLCFSPPTLSTQQLSKPQDEKLQNLLRVAFIETSLRFYQVTINETDNLPLSWCQPKKIFRPNHVQYVCKKIDIVSRFQEEIGKRKKKDFKPRSGKITYVRGVIKR